MFLALADGQITGKIKNNILKQLKVVGEVNKNSMLFLVSLTFV